MRTLPPKMVQALALRFAASLAASPHPDPLSPSAGIPASFRIISPDVGIPLVGCMANRGGLCAIHRSAWRDCPKRGGSDAPDVYLVRVSGSNPAQ